MDVKQLFIIKAIKKFGDKFDYSCLKYKDKSTPIKFTCPIHGDFYTPPAVFLKNREGCPKCGTIAHNRAMLHYYKQKASKRFNNYYNYDLINLNNYLNSNTKVPIECPKHGVFYNDMYSHAKGKRCFECARENRNLTLDEFINRSNRIHGKKYDYSLVTFRYIVDKVTIICPIHGPFIQEVRSHISKCGCPKCSREAMFSTREIFVEKAKKVHGDRYLYDKVIYTGRSNKVIVTCKKHGDFLVRPKLHISGGTGCPKCNISFGEITITSLLDKLNIEYHREYTPERSVRLYRYDFYLPDFNLLIEFHSRQHYVPVEKFGGEKAFRETRVRDRAKVVLAKNSVLTLLWLTINIFIIKPYIVLFFLN